MDPAFGVETEYGFLSVMGRRAVALQTSSELLAKIILICTFLDWGLAFGKDASLPP